IVTAARAGTDRLPEVSGFVSAAGGGVSGIVHDAGPGLDTGSGTGPGTAVQGTEHRVAAGRSGYIGTQLAAGSLSETESAVLAEAEAAGATAVWVAVDGR